MKECKAFQMSNPKNALEHIRNNFEGIKKYDLYQFDDGYRIFGKCKECNSYILIQSNEYHSFSDGEDSYYKDYFPVKNEEEVEELNKRYGGLSIEDAIDRKSIAVSNGEICFKDRRKSFYIDIKNKNDRENFINMVLNMDYIGLKCSNSSSFESAKEEIINSIFPISINLGKLEVDYIKNTTGAAASIADKSKFITPEEAFERVKNEIERWKKYKEDVINCLITGAYRYNEKDARNMVEGSELEILEEFFKKGETANECAVKIEYCCE